jgi:hypothetical protein
MSSQGANAAGNWKIVDYPQHLECVECQIKIIRDAKNPNLYEFIAHGLNELRNFVEYNPTDKKWDPQSFSMTETIGSPEQMEKDGFLLVLISGVQKLEIQD